MVSPGSTSTPDSSTASTTGAGSTTSPTSAASLGGGESKSVTRVSSVPSSSTSTWNSSGSRTCASCAGSAIIVCTTPLTSTVTALRDAAPAFPSPPSCGCPASRGTSPSGPAGDPSPSPGSSGGSSGAGAGSSTAGGDSSATGGGSSPSAGPGPAGSPDSLPSTVRGCGGGSSAPSSGPVTIPSSCPASSPGGPPTVIHGSAPAGIAAADTREIPSTNAPSPMTILLAPAGMSPASLSGRRKRPSPRAMHTPSGERAPHPFSVPLIDRTAERNRPIPRSQRCTARASAGARRRRGPMALTDTVRVAIRGPARAPTGRTGPGRPKAGAGGGGGSAAATAIPLCVPSGIVGLSQSHRNWSASRLCGAA